jgi:hypothetical protein
MSVNTNSATAARQRNGRKRRVDENRRKRANLVTQDVSVLRQLKQKMPTFNMDRLVETHSDYYKTLDQPFKINGVKIPDESTYPSSTFTISYKFTQTAIAAGAPATGNFLGFMIDGYQGGGMLRQANTYTGVATGWGTFGAGADPTRGPLPNWADVISVYQEVRVVSAGMSVKPSMSSLSDQGTMYAVSIPAKARDFSADTIYQTNASYGKGYTSVSCPVKDGGACICYRPTDPRNFIYSDPNKVLPSGDIEYLGGVVFAVFGCASGATFDFRIDVNYEGIPRYNTINLVSPTPSDRDGVEMDSAINAINKKPSVETGSAALQVATTDARPELEHATHMKTKKSGGFFKSILGTLGGIAKQALPMLVSEIPKLLV